MADLSKIKTPDGNEYDLKDAFIRNKYSQLEQLTKTEATESVPFTEVSVGYIRYADGESRTSSAYTSYTNYIDISKYKSITFKRTGVPTSSNALGMAFYTSAQTYITGQRTQVSQPDYGYLSNMETLDVPDTAKYARFTIFTDTTTYGNFELYGSYDVVQTASSVSAAIASLQSAVSDLQDAIGTDADSTSY